MKMKKLVSLLLVMVLVVGSFCGCGDSGSTNEQGYADSINVIVWEGVWADEVIASFEEEYGIKVNVSYVSNTDEILSKLLQGDVVYDIIDLEAAYIKPFVDNGLLAEINDDNVPNQQYIKEDIFGFTGDEDSLYTIPNYSPDYTCLVYNTETCPIEITSFQDLTDPALEGEVCMVNSTISLFGMALEALGYSAGTTSEEEIAAAADLLKAIKPNVKAFVGESAQPQLENGDCSVAFCWDYSVIMDNPENWGKFAIADIDTGYECFTQYFAISSASEKQEEAELFINYQLDPQNMALNKIENPANPPIAREYIEEYLPEGFYDNPAYNLDSKIVNSAWKVAVADEQIEIMDVYYTELMGN